MTDATEEDLGKVFSRFEISECNAVSTPMDANFMLLPDEGELHPNPSLYRAAIG